MKTSDIVIESLLAVSCSEPCLVSGAAMDGRRAGVWFHYEAPSVARCGRSTPEQEPYWLSQLLLSWRCIMATEVKTTLLSHQDQHPVATFRGRETLHAQLNPWRETPTDSWAEQQTQHLIEHLRQSALIHKVAQTLSRARAERGREGKRARER